MAVSFHFPANPPLGLYVHIPWCVRKCPYCDFNSHALKGQLPEQAYIAALLADLDREAAYAHDSEVQSVFIGGGTPSLFSPQAIFRLLTGIGERLSLSRHAEVTLEANPGTVEQSRFVEFHEAGINRLSIGVQSFSDDALRRLGRIHSGDEAVRAAESAHACGFADFNLDLMYGLPGQTVEHALADLHAAIQLEPSHLSWYQLTIEPNTRFHIQPPVLPGEALIDYLETRGTELLERSGFSRYEVSAYARSGRRCRHNLNYWHFGDYLGIGAGAHGKLTDTARNTVTRSWKSRHPKQYLAHATAGDMRAGQRTLGAADAIAEFMMNSLRLTDGFPAELFEKNTGLPFHMLAPALAVAAEKGMLECVETCATSGDAPQVTVRATDRGRRFLNDLTQLFLPQDGVGDAGCSG